MVGHGNTVAHNCFDCSPAVEIEQHRGVSAAVGAPANPRQRGAGWDLRLAAVVFVAVDFARSARMRARSSDADQSSADKALERMEGIMASSSAVVWS